MTYTAEKLITQSWYLSGIVARNLQMPTGDQINDGLNMLNALLNFKQIEIDLIPYYTYIQFPLIQGQEYYFLEYVAEVELATFNLDSVRYSTNPTSRYSYYGSPRVNNLQALPFNWNFIREEGGGTIAMYFLPQQNYIANAMVKIFLVDVNLTTDLTNVSETTSYTFVNSSNQGYDTSYIEYLRYALARYMCSEYGIVFNPQSEAIFRSYERKLMYIEPPDLSMRKQSILTSNRVSGWNWGDANIGRGYRPV